jgi:hypothetical protein
MALQVVDIALRKLFVVAFRSSLLLSLVCSKSSVDNVDNKTKHRNSRLVGDGSEDDGAALALAVMLKLALALMLAIALKHKWQRVTV